MRAYSSRGASKSHDAKRFQPAIGTDFGSIEETDAKTRSFIAKVTVPSGVVALAVSGAFSLTTGNYVAVLGVWGVVGPLLTAVVTYYFGPQRGDAG